MTIEQLESLNEEELGMALYIVNVIAPVRPPMEISTRGLLWFKRDSLIKKFLDVFPKLKPEGHAIYTSLMLKLGVAVEINKVEAPPPPVVESLPSTETPPPPV